MPSPIPFCRVHITPPGQKESQVRWKMVCQLDARCSVSQPLLWKPLGTGWRGGGCVTRSWQNSSLQSRPVVGIPSRLYGRHTSTPFLIQGRGGGGAQFQQVGLFCPHACRLWGILAKFCEFGKARTGWEGRVILTEWHFWCHNSRVSNIGQSHISGHSDSKMSWVGRISWRRRDDWSLLRFGQFVTNLALGCIDFVIDQLQHLSIQQQYMSTDIVLNVVNYMGPNCKNWELLRERWKTLWQRAFVKWKQKSNHVGELL